MLVFARFGRSNAEGAFATCHSLSLPPSEPGYYFWRDRETGRITRRSEWFVTKSPVVTIGTRQMKYLMSFALPRFCDQSLDRSRKGRFYPDAEPWMAKLDTVVHELYHIDPEHIGIRRIEREDGTYSANCHSPRFFEQVAEMVQTYLALAAGSGGLRFSPPRFRRRSSAGTAAWSARASGRSRRSRSATSSGSPRSCRPNRTPRGVRIEPMRAPQQPTHYTEDDLHIRQFSKARVAAARPQGQVQSGVIAPRRRGSARPSSAR